MTNQNVQTNRHGLQNKGCNQASADSKHYLVSKLRPPCPLAWTKEISVEAYVRDLGSLLMARHWQKHQKQFWKLPHSRDWSDHDVIKLLKCCYQFGFLIPLAQQLCSEHFPTLHNLNRFWHNGLTVKRKRRMLVQKGYYCSGMES